MRHHSTFNNDLNDTDEDSHQSFPQDEPFEDDDADDDDAINTQSLMAELMSADDKVCGF